MTHLPTVGQPKIVLKALLFYIKENIYSCCALDVVLTKSTEGKIILTYQKFSKPGRKTEALKPLFLIMHRKDTLCVFAKLHI